MGHNVLAVDTDIARLGLLTAGKPPFHEPNLPARMADEISAGRLAFSQTPHVCDIAVLAVGTPATDDGAADLSQLCAVIDAVAKLAVLPRALMIKSTVPVGTGDLMQARLRALRPDWNGVMISNPEFMRQGFAVADFTQPDRVVIGADDARGHTLGREVYANMDLPAERLICCKLASAELMKYAANTILATRLALVNELALLAEATGADILEIAAGIGMDRRIGPQFLRAGPGIGGSCFPKDIRALAHQAQLVDLPMAVVDAAIRSNESHISQLVGRIVGLCGGTVAGLRIAVLGVTFKSGTDDMRNSPALALIPALQNLGADVVVTDPMASDAAHRLLPDVTWVDDAYAAATRSDGLVVLTEWPEFAGLNLEKLAGLTRSPRMADLRNLYDPEAARAAGFEYQGLGRS